jgi:hypothetical protein
VTGRGGWGLEKKRSYGHRWFEVSGWVLGIQLANGHAS